MSEEMIELKKGAIAQVSRLEYEGERHSKATF